MYDRPSNGETKIHFAFLRNFLDKFTKTTPAEIHGCDLRKVGECCLWEQIVIKWP